DPIKKNYRRVAYSALQAQKTMRAIEDDYADHVAKLQTPNPTLRTFKDLADHYETNYLQPPVWHDGHKVEGLRSHKKAGTALRALKAAFDEKLLRHITWTELAEFKSKRLRSPVVIKHRKPPAPGSR